MKERAMRSVSLRVVMVVALVLALFTGCTKSKESDNSASPSPSASPSAAASAKPDQPESNLNATGLPIVKEPITIKMMVAKHVSDKTTWAEKEAIKQAEKETGIKLEITEVPSISWNEKIGITISSDNLPDVIVGGIPNFAMYTDSFMPLNELIDQYSPVLTDLYKDHPEYKFAATFPDGNVYSLPLLQTLGSRVSLSFSINKTWLDKLSLPVPETVDELYTTLKAFKENDMNGNGKKDEIPYSFYDDPYYGLDVMLWNFGLLNDNYTNVMIENGKAFFVPSDPRYYEYLKFMHKLYAEGLIDPDGFVQKNADYINKGKSGVIGFFNHHSYDDIVVGSDNTNDYISILPMKQADGSIVAGAKKVAGDFFFDKVVINRNSKYAAEFVRLYDYMNSSFEKMMLLSYGPEGTVWNKVDGDKWERASKLPDGFDNFALVRQTFSPGMAGFFLLKDEDAARLNITLPRDLKVQEKEAMYTPYLPKEEIPMGQDPVEVALERSKLATEQKTYLSNFVAQSIMKGINDAQWEEHLSNLKKLSIDKYVQGFQDLYDRSKK